MATAGAYFGQQLQNSVTTVKSTLPPNPGGFFANDFQKHAELKDMLDSKKDSQKLEAMKRIIGMIAKGKDASMFFPSVVKNVVSVKIELKKLVYVYLVRYAEEQQDLALLSISTFQRALKDPNQLVRASALRVLSSIRIPVIVPIMMLALKDAAYDMSPYVRKTAAHAIPKLYSMDSEQRNQLIEVIEKLLSDKITLVVGSAVMAFDEVCPERIDLIHKNYRKLCTLLPDVEEWGQIAIVQMLTRYSRTQFADPNKTESSKTQDDKNFYDDEETAESKPYVMDPDHFLLLRNTKPLLQSRNSAVVMAVSQLYYYIAPRTEMVFVAKALVRLLHNHREVQFIVLTNIATTSTKTKEVFLPFLKSFFVRASDPTQIKLLKLEIITNIATDANISTILHEFQTYISSPDMKLVTATIQAIGRCGSEINEVTDMCLNGLVALLSHSNKMVVAESVVVIKNLLQIEPNKHTNIIVHMAKLVESTAVPMARAAILWLLGEYANCIPKVAPDVLRKFAKSFTNEEDIVKLQILNLASKLFLTNAKQTSLLTQYVFSLAKYDQNYDIRDRARFLKNLIMPQSENKLLSKYSKKILLAKKPAPTLQSKFRSRDMFCLGSLSHFINAKANGYCDLPEFPDVPPDPTTRNVEVPQLEKWLIEPKKKPKEKSFYSETESSYSDKTDDSEEEDDSEDDEDSQSSQNSLSEDSSESDATSEDSPKMKKKYQPIGEKKVVKKSFEPKGSSSSDIGETDSSDSSDDDDNTSTDEERKQKPKQPKNTKSESNLDLLLDLYSSNDSAPILQAEPPKSNSQNNNSILPVCNPAYIPQTQHELLNRFTGKGLVVKYRFTRSPNIFSPQMTTLELTFHNQGDKEVKGIAVSDTKNGNIEVKGFSPLLPLAVNAFALAMIGINYNESTNPVNLKIKTEKQNFDVAIKPPFGEILQPVLLSEDEFLSLQKKLKGMNECFAQFKTSQEKLSSNAVVNKTVQFVNMTQVSTVQENSGTLRFAGQTLNTKSLLLVTIQVLNNDEISICVNCENVILATILLKELKECFSK